MSTARRPDMIGDRVLKVIYRRGQKHSCDPACRAADHIHQHTYRKPIPFLAGKSGEVRAPARIYTREGARELYAVDNPPLLIVNGPKQRRQPAMATYKMKRNSKGQFVAVRNAPRRRSAKRKTKARRNAPPFWTAGALVNSPRKKRRGPRRNPPAALKKILGFPFVLPDVADVLAISGGLAGPPLVKGFAMQLLPASVTTSSTGKMGIEIGSYIVPPAIGYALGGRQGLKMVLAGEAAAVAVRLIGNLTSRISSSLPNLAAYRPSLTTNSVRARGVNSYLTAQPGRKMLGAYANSRRSPRSVSNHTGGRTR